MTEPMTKAGTCPEPLAKLRLLLLDDERLRDLYKAMLFKGGLMAGGATALGCGLGGGSAITSFFI